MLLTPVIDGEKGFNIRIFISSLPKVTTLKTEKDLSFRFGKY